MMPPEYRPIQETEAERIRAEAWYVRRAELDRQYLERIAKGKGDIVEKKPRAKPGDGWTSRRRRARWMDADPCAYCGGPADEYDHIVPRKRGGKNGDDNLAHACHSCNHEKSSRPLLLFLTIRAQRKVAGTWKQLPEMCLPRPKPLTIGHYDRSCPRVT